MANKPTIDDVEGSKGGARSVMLLAIVSACLLVMLILVGSGAIVSGGKSVAPNATQPNTESPATGGAQEPKQ
jgi:hypothetical protein